jgi:predicted lipid-binding transport protein (Tim44 family)
MLTMALVAMLVLGFIAFVMRKRMAAQGALARTGDASPVRSPMLGTGIGSGIGAGIASGPTGSAAAPGGAQPIPADFDKAGFERTARDQFARLQAANDSRDLDRLRDYLSPEMFDIVRAEIAERGDAPQRTETFGLEAQVLEVAEEADRYVVSVRFTGSVREQAGREIEDLDEVWHLTKPRSGFGGWVIAGIQQSA